MITTRFPAFAAVCSLCVSFAAAQNESALAEMDKVYQSIVKPGKVLPVDEGRRIEGRLREWGLTADTLSGEKKQRLLAVEILSALALSDAGKAAPKAAELAKESTADAATLEIAYYGACAAGDAQAADEALRRLSDRAQGDARKLAGRRRAGVAQMGREAPDIEIATDDVQEIKPRKRGDKILVIDFWNTLSEPPAEHVSAMKALFAEYKGDANVQMLGVNADSESRLDKAKEFAKKSAFEWPQRYERVAIKAPITHEAFKAGQPPWFVLIDSYGYIRAIGSADDLGFVYAFRAALAEARGDFPPVMPRTRDGKQPKRESQQISTSDKPAAGGAAAPAGELPSNPDAQALLRQAHTLRRGGSKTKARELYQRIINEFPGTKEAKEAAEWLEP